MAEERKKRSKEDVKSKKAIFHGKRKDGKPKRIGVKVTFKDGDVVTLLNPSGKGEKYARELKDGKRYTNDGVVKTDKDGQVLTLTKEQYAYRSAYLQSQKDSSNAYKARKAKTTANK